MPSSVSIPCTSNNDTSSDLSSSIHSCWSSRLAGHLGARNLSHFDVSDASGDYNEKFESNLAHSPTHSPICSFPQRCPAYSSTPSLDSAAPNQDIKAARWLKIPLWDDPDVLTLRWEDCIADSNPTRTLRELHHLYLKKSTKDAVRVIMRGKDGSIQDFLAPSFENSPLPRLAFGDLRRLFPILICSYFEAGGEFVRKDELIRVHLDFFPQHNYVNEQVIKGADFVPRINIPNQIYEPTLGQYEQLKVESRVELMLKGKGAEIAYFPFSAYVVSQEKNQHFPYKMI